MTQTEHRIEDIVEIFYTEVTDGGTEEELNKVEQACDKAWVEMEINI
jgi:hypothetical protein